MQLLMVITLLKKMEKYGLDKTQRPVTADSLKKISLMQKEQKRVININH